jgi:Xaa-Pro aminopeptidase
VDAGTVELVRAAGPQVVSSGDLVQRFEAVWTDEAWRLHREAERHTVSAYDRAWRFVADAVRRDGATDELAVQREIERHFAEHELTTYHLPIVAVGPHSGDPHYETGTGGETSIRAGDFLLIDLWAKLDRPGATYSDLTRVGFVGETVPARHAEIFGIVAAARDAAIRLVEESFAVGRPLRGWQVDRAARDVIDRAGYGERFVHRTGHSIGQETHGNGANMDDLETREERLVLPGTCFSIEPGIYLPEFGVRSEVNVFVAPDRTVHVTGGPLQTAVVPILAAHPA